MVQQTQSLLRDKSRKHTSENIGICSLLLLKKAFDRVPRKVLWWALRKVGIPEWIVHVIQVMYQNARSQVKVNNFLSDVFDMQAGVHQGSVLSPLLSIIVLEALSREFRTSCPRELLYADDLVLIADTMDELLSNLGNWKKTSGSQRFKSEYG